MLAQGRILKRSLNNRPKTIKVVELCSVRQKINIFNFSICFFAGTIQKLHFSQPLPLLMNGQYTIPSIFLPDVYLFLRLNLWISHHSGGIWTKVNQFFFHHLLHMRGDINLFFAFITINFFTRALDENIRVHLTVSIKKGVYKPKSSRDVGSNIPF